MEVYLEAASRAVVAAVDKAAAERVEADRAAEVRVWVGVGREGLGGGSGVRVWVGGRAGAQHGAPHLLVDVAVQLADRPPRDLRVSQHLPLREE